MVCLGLGRVGVAFDFGVDVLVADFAAIAVAEDLERGGEGARPMDGDRCEMEGRFRFSRGLRNMRGRDYIADWERVGRWWWE